MERTENVHPSATNEGGYELRITRIVKVQCVHNIFFWKLLKEEKSLENKSMQSRYED